MHNEVKSEKTGIRDLELNNRHRLWGWDCPMVDIDLLAVEYDSAEPVAFVDYKHMRMKRIDYNSSSFEALRKVADRCGLPFFIAIYNPNEWSFWVIPMNDTSRKFFANWIGIVMTEQEYVDRLYEMRNHVRKAFRPDLPPAVNTQTLNQTATWKGWSLH